MRFVFFIIALILVNAPCHAQLKEFAHIYDVPADENIPNTLQLEKEYRKSVSDYDWHYDFSWNIPPVFDKEFSANIQYFGNVEKRINSADEEKLLQELKRIPPVFYPYIGPMLYKVPGLSGKILDLPGIKGTKHQFPKRIASKLSNIPNIEFVSPELYIFLMPQIFGENTGSLEFPQLSDSRPNIPAVRIKRAFLDRLAEKVPAQDFALDAPQKKKKDNPRHYNADQNTPLSTADVSAFIDTLDVLQNFQSSGRHEIDFIAIGGLISYWDEKNGIDKNVSFLKSAVNPCQSIARKVKWLGLRNEFQQVIGTQAFGLDDWAYTCDKTLKAFRAASQNNAYTTTLNLLKKGYAYKMINQFSYYTPQERQTHKYFIEAVIQMFDSTPENIAAIRPEVDRLREKLLPFNANILGSPLVMP